MAYLSRVKLPSNIEYDLKAVLQTVVGTQTSNTASWTGVINVDELVNGMTIAYFLPRTSSSNATLKLTLKGGTQTDAIPVYFSGNTRVGTQYPAGSTIVLSYFTAGSISIGGTATSDNRWVAINYTNSDSKVSQTTTSTNGEFDILFSTTASGGATKTEGAQKDSDFHYNPSTNTLTVSTVEVTTINGVTVGSTPEFTDTTYTASAGVKIATGNDIQHTNSVTAKTTQAIYPIKYDAQGHITGSGSAFTPGDAATKGVDSSIASGSTSTNLPTTKAVVDFIASLPQAMIFKGTVGTSSATIQTLPAASSSNNGWTYKVIGALTTPVVAKVGDTVISNGSEWVVIPSGDEPSGTVTSVAISAGNGGVTVSGGPITSSGTLTVSHADTSSAESIVVTSGKFVNGLTIDTYGHVTAISVGDVDTADEKVKQTAASTTNKDYRILLSNTDSDTEETAGVKKDTDFKYNPSTNNLMVGKINGVTVGASPEFTDTVTTVSYTKSNGSGTFSQTKEGTQTTIFQTTDANVDGVGTWSAGSLPSLTKSATTVVTNASLTAGTTPITVSVEQGTETLVFATGTAPSLSAPTSSIDAVGTWSAGSLPSLTTTPVTGLAKVNPPSA